MATIETIKAAGLTKLTKFNTNLCKKSPINGSVLNGVALVAINTIEANKNKDISLSSIFNKPTTIPNSNKTSGTQFAELRTGINANIIEINSPNRKV
jgi:hypothetical protein